MKNLDRCQELHKKKNESKHIFGGSGDGSSVFLQCCSVSRIPALIEFRVILQSNVHVLLFCAENTEKKQHCDNVLANDPTYNMCVRGCVVFFHMFADPGGPFKYNVCHLIGETVFYVC